MCRNIRTLFNFQPPATATEVEATAALLSSLVTSAPSRDREVEAARAMARAKARFG